MEYASVGEVSPILTLERNRVVNNCRQLYGNFSTCNAAIKVDVQNMQSLYFRVSYIQPSKKSKNLIKFVFAFRTILSKKTKVD